ncbi:hypothetical protein BHE74_00007981 [Ensete ventricosum]|nr:hypothetical protein BHE74_00007981 [Ensete ventricosum]
MGSVGGRHDDGEDGKEGRGTLLGGMRSTFGFCLGAATIPKKIRDSPVEATDVTTWGGGGGTTRRPEDGKEGERDMIGWDCVQLLAFVWVRPTIPKKIRDRL